MKALGRLNTAFFLVGFLGFLTTWILDMIYMFLRKAAVKQPNEIIKALFSAFAPQYLLSRSLYDISQTYLEASGRPNADPFTYAVTGRAFLLLALQAVGRALLFSFCLTRIGKRFYLFIIFIYHNHQLAECCPTLQHGPQSRLPVASPCTFCTAAATFCIMLFVMNTSRSFSSWIHLKSESSPQNHSAAY